MSFWTGSTPSISDTTSSKRTCRKNSRAVSLVARRLAVHEFDSPSGSMQLAISFGKVLRRGELLPSPRHAPFLRSTTVCGGHFFRSGELCHIESLRWQVTSSSRSAMERAWQKSQSHRLAVVVENYSERRIYKSSCAVAFDIQKRDDIAVSVLGFLPLGRVMTGAFGRTTCCTTTTRATFSPTTRKSATPLKLWKRSPEVVPSYVLQELHSPLGRTRRTGRSRCASVN